MMCSVFDSGSGTNEARGRIQPPRTSQSAISERYASRTGRGAAESAFTRFASARLRSRNRTRSDTPKTLRRVLRTRLPSPAKENHPDASSSHRNRGMVARTRAAASASRSAAVSDRTRSTTVSIVQRPQWRTKYDAAVTSASAAARLVGDTSTWAPSRRTTRKGTGTSQSRKMRATSSGQGRLGDRPAAMNKSPNSSGRSGRRLRITAEISSRCPASAAGAVLVAADSAVWREWTLARCSCSSRAARMSTSTAGPTRAAPKRSRTRHSVRRWPGPPRRARAPRVRAPIDHDRKIAPGSGRIASSTSGGR